MQWICTEACVCIQKEHSFSRDLGKEGSNRNGLSFLNNLKSSIQHRIHSLVKQKVRNICAVASFCLHVYIRECGSTLYVGMAQGVSFSLYIGIGAKFENTQKTGERRLCTAEYRTVLL